MFSELLSSWRKGAGHRYIRRTPYFDKKGRKRYRYIYQAQRGGGVAGSEAMVEGAAFKLTHNGKAGHFHVESVSGDRLKIRHDESGGELELTRSEFQRLLRLEHGEARGKAPKGKAPKGKAPKGKAPKSKAPKGKAPKGKTPAELATALLGKETKKPESRRKSPPVKFRIGPKPIRDPITDGPMPEPKSTPEMRRKRSRALPKNFRIGPKPIRDPITDGPMPEPKSTPEMRRKRSRALPRIGNKPIRLTRDD